MTHMLENQARYGIDMQPVRLAIEPNAFIRQALTIAGMIRL
jgi:hypothetical protein